MMINVIFILGFKKCSLIQGIQSVLNHFLSVQFNQLIRELAGVWIVNAATVIFLFYPKRPFFTRRIPASIVDIVLSVSVCSRLLSSLVCPVTAVPYPGLNLLNLRQIVIGLGILTVLRTVCPRAIPEVEGLLLYFHS